VDDNLIFMPTLAGVLLLLVQVLAGLHSSPIPVISILLNLSEFEQCVFKFPTSHGPANLPTSIELPFDKF
jgi:hypothetical protein